MLCVTTWPLANIRANIASRYTRPHNSPFLAASEQWSVIWTIRESNGRLARLEDGQFWPLGDVGWRWLEMRLWREIVDGGGRSPFKSGAAGDGRVSFFIRSLSALPPWTISSSRPEGVFRHFPSPKSFLQSNEDPIPSRFCTQRRRVKAFGKAYYGPRP